MEVQASAKDGWQTYQPTERKHAFSTLPAAVPCDPQPGRWVNDIPPINFPSKNPSGVHPVSGRFLFRAGQ